MSYWIISPEGKEFGPVELDGLLQWVREGRVLKTTLVRKDDAAPAPAEGLPELAQALAPPAAAPPMALAVTLPGELTAWGFIGMAWDLVKPHWLPLGLMFLIHTALSCIPYIGGCISLVVTGPIYVGINRAILGMLAGKTPDVGMMFQGFDRFGQAFLACLVMGILSGLGFLLCIVPGVLLTVMWAFTYPILSETGLGFWDAMQASLDLTRGYRWKLFLLGLCGFLLVLLGLLCCCVGAFIAEAVVFTSFALAYRWLQARQARA